MQLLLTSTTWIYNSALCLSVSFSVSVSLCLFISLSLSVCLSFCPSFTFCLTVCLSVHFSLKSQPGIHCWAYYLVFASVPLLSLSWLNESWCCEAITIISKRPDCNSSGEKIGCVSNSFCKALAHCTTKAHIAQEDKTSKLKNFVCGRNDDKICLYHYMFSVVVNVWGKLASIALMT